MKRGEAYDEHKFKHRPRTQKCVPGAFFYVDSYGDGGDRHLRPQAPQVQIDKTYW